MERDQVNAYLWQLILENVIIQFHFTSFTFVWHLALFEGESSDKECTTLEPIHELNRAHIARYSRQLILPQVKEEEEYFFSLSN